MSKVTPYEEPRQKLDDSRKTKRHIIDFFGAVMQNGLRIIALKND